MHVGVSICIPTYCHERTIEACVESALAQSMDDIEVVVIDDCSPDSTLERVHAVSDPRLRVYCNAHNVGAVANHNRCIRAAKGRFVQMLHGDDLLEPECVASLSEVLAENPSAGFAFASRNVVLEGNGLEDRFGRWIEQYGDCCEPLVGPIETRPQKLLLSGPEVLSLYICKGFRGNWFGEPSSVLLREDALRDVGCFNAAVKQNFDVDLWLRILCRWDAVYVREILSTRRVHAGMLSAANDRAGNQWLDRPLIAQDVIDTASNSVRLSALPAWRRRWLALKTRDMILGRVDRSWRNAWSLFDLIRRSLIGDARRALERGRTRSV